MRIVTGNELQFNEVAQNNTSRHFLDFKTLLTDLDAVYTVDGFYLQVGEILQVQGWILHLSVAKMQMVALLQLIIPELLNRDVPFKVIRDSETARHILDAGLGYYRLGKIMALYPKEGTDLLSLANDLIALTKNFRGPSIPTDRYLGGILYTRYGSYNPVLKKDSPGKVRYIYSETMQLIPDEYKIPYVPPAHLIWPFGEIAPPAPPAVGKLMKNTYKPLFVIKDDTKGRVLKGIYMKGFLNFRHCIIKEGKKNMWLDEHGRDIQDRLRWQFDLCKELSDAIPFPEIFDLFEENGDLYLAMEFINGRSLEETVLSIYKECTWLNLSVNNKLLLLKHFTKLAHILQQFHERGYIHRDITPANFLIDRKDRIFLIDMELSYAAPRNLPCPPFKFGTAGYVSPEQKAFQQPDVKQDIYAVGALMIFMFTGLPPVKFNIRLTAQLIESIVFLTGDLSLSEMITACVHADPGERPSLPEVIRRTAAFQKEYSLLPRGGIDARSANKEALSDERTVQIINAALRGLKEFDLLTSDLLWDSPVLLREQGKNAYIERGYLPGFYNGMSGILYCLAKAVMLGYSIDTLLPAYNSSLAFIRNSLADEFGRLQPTLYDGTGGIAVALCEGLDAGLIPHSKELELLLVQCFGNTAGSLGYADGVAGQGVVLIYCSKWLDTDFVRSTLIQYRGIIMNKQLKDGSWSINDLPENKGRRDVSFINGIPGIINFLLMYTRIDPDESVITAIRKALAWLIKAGTRRNGTLFWEAGGQATGWLLSHDYGIPGIISLFITAYDILKDPVYKDVAQGALGCLSPFPVSADLTQANGLSGLGEVYLHAYTSFGNEEWKSRANWIANTIERLVLTDKHANVCWSMDYSSDFIADLMTGSAGIIHFFMHYRAPEKGRSLLYCAQ
jgi:serine/threonine protein kinase